MKKYNFKLLKEYQGFPITSPIYNGYYVDEKSLTEGQVLFLRMKHDKWGYPATNDFGEIQKINPQVIKTNYYIIKYELCDEKEN